tara:strand:+ start:303 stop:728 length:426 start_codon:yes stop_codon:yes gene_type:complete
MTWRKKNDWEGYKDFLRNTDICDDFSQRYDYRLRRYVGADNARERIDNKIAELESAIDKAYDDEGAYVYLVETVGKNKGNPIENVHGSFIHKLIRINDETKVYRMNSFIKHHMHSPTKKFRRHMFKYLYFKRLEKYKGGEE